MKKFVDFVRKEDGLTLIELIAALVLFTLVAGIISAITMFGIRSYHKISIENSLRDEGDILMSAIITELYTFAPQEISATTKRNEDRVIVDSSILLKRTENGVETTSQIRIHNGVLTITDSGQEASAVDPRTQVQSRLAPGSGIILECQKNTKCESGLITIDLSLVQSYDGRDYPLDLRSKFGF